MRRSGFSEREEKGAIHVHNSFVSQDGVDWLDETFRGGLAASAHLWRLPPPFSFSRSALSFTFFAEGGDARSSSRRRLSSGMRWTVGGRCPEIGEGEAATGPFFLRLSLWKTSSSPHQASSLCYSCIVKQSPLSDFLCDFLMPAS